MKNATQIRTLIIISSFIILVLGCDKVPNKKVAQEVKTENTLPQQQSNNEHKTKPM